MTSHESYSKIKALNWSSLKVIGISPLAYHRGLQITREDTPAMALGRAVHAAVLEPDRYEAEWAVWSGGVRRGKAWDEWRAARGDSEIITADQAALVDTIVTAVSQHSAARSLIDGAQTEVTAEWLDVDTPCKGRLDVVTSTGRVVDLKTTSRTTIREIRRQAAAADYHGQIAWYHDGACRAGLVDGATPPAIIYVQTVEPYDVIVDELSDATYRAGVELYRAYMSLYRECEAANYWPGMQSGMGLWDLPAWAADKALDVDNGGEL